MNIYICNTPIEFPRSEYGGLVVAIAKSPKQLGKMLTEHYEKEAGRYFNLGLSVKSTKALELNPVLNYQAGIVEEFLT